MKFFCEQCKAKYQIADEKVAGKTVRMKCRKCGHVIELRAEVTESSAIAHAPLGSQAPSPAGSGSDAPARPSAPRAPARPPPKPSALATSLTAAKPAPPKPAAERSTSGALAGAFKSNVQREDETSTPFDMADLAPGDDWYVAVNGVPVGPIRIAEVRRKAALGAVTEDSLVWQEGLDEWRPLRTFPDLAANVREAAAGGRISITPPPPDARTSSPPPPRSPSLRSNTASAIPSRVGSSRPQTSQAPAARSNVVPITSRLATAERLDDAPTEIGALPVMPSAAPDPFALPPPAAAIIPSPGALAPPNRPAVAPVGPASIAPSKPAERRPIPWIPITMVAGSVTFAAMAGISLFFKQSAPTTTVIQVPVAATTGQAAAIAPAPTATAAPTAEPSASAAPAPTARSPIAAGGTPHAAAAATATSGRSLDLHSLTQGTNIAPSAGDEPGGDGPPAPGQCLSSAQVQQVIQLHQVAIRRSCWERSATTKLTANVSVSLTIGSDGSAQGVSASGDDPAVAKCIENDVHGWHFPAMGCSQKTGFSFKFVKQ